MHEENAVSLVEQLRDKWREVPASRQERHFSTDLMNLGDAELIEYWEECRRQTSTPDVRGWYHEHYKSRLIGQRVADIGSGIGIDGVWFAQHGAHVTFADIVPDNLALVRRICELKGLDANYYYIDDFFHYQFTTEFDCIMCIGSLINAPFDFTKLQAAALVRSLRVGGSILMLGYPKERYEALGAKDGSEFGKMTDGPRTPWAEWYDDEKVRALFGSDFCLEWSRGMGAGNTEFNWFELTKLR